MGRAEGALGVGIEHGECGISGGNMPACDNDKVAHP